MRLVVINGDNRQNMRGLARVNNKIAADATRAQMVAMAYLSHHADVRSGRTTVPQGVRSLMSSSGGFSGNLLLQSEQLPTRLFTSKDEHKGQVAAAGLLLQILPDWDTRVLMISAIWCS